MRHLLLFYVIILLSCSSQKPAKLDENSRGVDLVELHIRGYVIDKRDIEVFVEVVNNSSDTIKILKGSPLKKRDNGPSKVIVPYFFSAELNGDKANCLLVEPLQDGAFLQEHRFFATLEPGRATEVKLRINDFESFYCDDLNFEIKVKYELDKRLLDKLVFDKEIASQTKQPKKVTDHFYEKMILTYPRKLEASIMHKVPQSEVYMRVMSLETVLNEDYIVVEVVNQSNSTIKILQPRAMENGRNFTRKAVIPDFFNVQYKEETTCDTFKYELLEELKFKTTFDFIEIAAGRSTSFTLIGSHYFGHNCGKENTIELSYQYESRFDGSEYFNSQIKAKSQFGNAFYQRVHRALRESYKEPLKTTIYLK